MWPNKNNYSNFGLENKKNFKKKYYLYKYCSSFSQPKKTVNYSIDKMVNFKTFIKSKKVFF